MFRQAALRKGHLKPIKAFDGRFIGPMPGLAGNQGQMVGGINTAAQVPALRKAPTFFERMSVSRPVQFAKGIFNIPAAIGFEATGKVLDGFGMQDSPYKMPLQVAGGYAATRLPMMAPLMGLGIGPSAVGLATLYGIGNRVNAGIELRKKIKAMSPADYEKFKQEQDANAFGYMSSEDFDSQFKQPFIPKIDEIVKPKTDASVKVGPGSGRVNVPGGKSRETLLSEGDQLVDDKFASIDGTSDINKIQENSMGMPPGPPGSSDEDALTAKGGVFKPKEDVADQTSGTGNNDAAQNGDNIISKGGSSDDEQYNKNIALARKYQKFVDEGQASQANLVFLANLASGLLTGTSRKGGIGGAMEVLGQALGPAVNNYATIKLKEGELRRNSREASLNAALDHMEFLNDNAKADRPDQTGGIVQIRGADGRLRNFKAYQMKDGTITMAAGIVDGRESFVPIAQGEPIKDSQGRVIGNFENFLEQKTVDNRLFDIQDILGNRYNALSVTRDVLKTLNQLDESGDPVKAGAALSVDQFTRRLMGVSKELFGFEVSGLTLDQLENKVAELQADEYAAIDRDPDLSDEQKQKAKEKLDSNNLIKQAKERLKSRGLLSGLSREEQEKLAVQETTLVYALANTFKDQDRLTQRDIDAARNIVNIFSLTRSSKDVKASIEAIGRQLEADIRRQESLYTTAGGLETTLQDLRRLKNFEVFEGTVTQQLTSDLGVEEIKKELEGLEL